ncbi:MAG: SH3 domain-containing protein [Caldilineaceae bacterium]
MKIYATFTQKLLKGAATAFVFVLCCYTPGLMQSPTTGAVNRNANLRAGPGTTYAIVGSARLGETVTIVDTNEAGDWYQLADDQWIAAFLVNTTSTTLVATATSTVPRQPPAAATPLATSSTVFANRNANLRAGPGTTYAIVGGVRTGQTLVQVGRNADSSWLQLEDGTWIAAFLVNASAPTPGVTATSASVAPTATPAPAASGNHFVLVQQRLLDPTKMVVPWMAPRFTVAMVAS